MSASNGRAARGAPGRAAPAVLRNRPRALITGGAGFIGANLADRLASAGERVLVLDDLSRSGVERNLAWLEERHGERIATEVADVRDADAVRDATRHAGTVFHLAAQVAVTSSVDDPVGDFEINARGTLNVLEAVRARTDKPPLVFASTNKVYGEAYAASELVEAGRRYVPAEGVPPSVDEARPLDLSSPYGCSKGAADQYVLDYARVYGVPSVAFRMSCIFGPRQFGTEDQGWVAHFLIRAMRGQPITIFGDGKQVRDLLLVDDAIEAYLGARRRIGEVAGHAFNLGGGRANAVSLLELLDHLADLGIARPPVRFAAWRPGDQPYYVSDTTKLRRAIGWQPTTGLGDGLGRLHRWLLAAQPLSTRIAADKVPA